MKTSTKAVLLSALVFPGSGHLLLKKYRSAAVLAGIAFAGLYYLISSAVDTALQISAELQSGNVQPDVAAISDLLAQQTTSSDAQLANLATIAVGVCWVFGIVDSYRVGRMRDQAAGSQNTVR